MERSQTFSSYRIEVISAAPEQQPIIANLLELYAHDFSEYIDLKLGPDGRFGYQALPLYWTESNHYPFLVRVDGHWAGFVLARKGSAISGDENVWDMAEFFIVRAYRRRGIGTKVAHDIWRRFPGEWEVRVIDQNQKARDFWRGAISEFVGRTVQAARFEMEGRVWNVFSFESRPAS